MARELALDDGAQDIHNKKSRLARVLALAMQRHVPAVLNTSLTTAIAFVATSVSPILPVKSFGTFAATSIICLYFICIFIEPMIMANYHLSWEDTKCCGYPCIDACAKKAPAAVEGGVDLERGQSGQTTDLDDNVEVKTSCYGFLCENDLVRIFIDHFWIPVMTFPTYFKAGEADVEDGQDQPNAAPVRKPRRDSILQERQPSNMTAMFIVAALTTFGVIMTYQASKLQPPTSEEQWMKDGHMYTTVTQLDNWMGTDTNRFLKSNLVFGISGIDRTGFDYQVPGENRGVAIYDPDFSNFAESNTPLLVKSMRHYCTVLETAPCGPEYGCEGTGKLTVEHTLECALGDQFDDYLAAYAEGRTIENCIIGDVLGYWKVSDKEEFEHGKRLGFQEVDGKWKLQWMEIYYTMAVGNRVALSTKNKLRELLDQIFLDAYNELDDAAKPAFQDAYPTDRVFWAWSRTEQGLVDGLFLGMQICFPAIFVVLLIATGNILIASYATLSIGFIVGCVRFLFFSLT